MPADTWVSVRRCSQEVGRAEPTIRRAIKEARIRSRRESGRVLVHLGSARDHFGALEAAGRGRPAGGRGPAPGEMTAAEWAALVGVAERVAQRWRRDGRIKAYTHEEAQAQLAARAGERGAQERSVDVVDADMDALRQADLHDIRRRKEYEQARLAKIKADEAEGKVYPAEEVEARVRHLAQAVDAMLREIVMVFPGQLALQSDAEIRSYTARWAQRKREDLRRLSGAKDDV